MDVVALILAISAFFAFFCHELTFGGKRVAGVNLGLALLTVALICQFVAISGDTVIRGH